MAQHQSQCLIFANQQLNISNIFLCSCCFQPTATWLSFRCWPTLISPFTNCFHWANQPFKPFPEILQLRSIQNHVSAMTTRASSSYDILPITKVINLNAIMTSNIEEFIAYYNAMLHVSIKIMTTQQRCYLLLNYFNNNKINFLFSCEIRSWSLRFCQFDICQVNAAQSNTLVHCIVPNKWAKFSAKIFRHFWDIAVFVLGYFILPHPVEWYGYQTVKKRWRIWLRILRRIHERGGEQDKP